MKPLRRIAVVIPARDEQDLLDSCLQALAVAIGNSPLPTRAIVVLDSCGDASASICKGHQVETIEVDFANVGRARHAGISALQSQAPAEALWIANTDADSQVPPGWLAEQVRLADEGADAVLGLVEVTYESGSPLPWAHHAEYRRRIRANGSHGHIHGANLGIRASIYLDAGGFPPLSDHEDRELVRRVRALASSRVVTTTSLRVKTSGRQDGRCQDGFARSIAAAAAP